MKIDFFDTNEKKPVIFDGWLYENEPPHWWNKVTPTFRALYNDYGPMVLVTHQWKNYLALTE